METRTYQPLYASAEDVRAIFGSYLRLKVVEKRRLFFWRRFLVTGPAEVLDEAHAEYEAKEGDAFWNWQL